MRVGVDTDVRRDGGAQAADEQRRPDHEHEGHRDLPRQQHRAHAPGSCAPAHRVPLQYRQGLDAQDLQRRHESAEKCRRDSRNQTASRQRPGPFEVQRANRNAAGQHEPAHHLQQPDRDQQAGERTAAREQERLGEKEPQQAEPAHAESHPDRGLPPPVLVPRQHQPGQIRAPHEEHQADHGDEQADEAFRLRPGPERQGRRRGRHERHRFRLLGRGARGGERGERRLGAGGAHSRSQLPSDGDPLLG